MLELLAGPLQVKTQAGVATTVSGGTELCWVDGWGLVSNGSNGYATNFYAGVMRMDGTFHPNWYTQGGNSLMGWDMTQGNVELLVSFIDVLYRVDPRTFHRQPDLVAQSTPTWFYPNQILKLPDRLLYVANFRVYSSVDHGVTWTLETALTMTGGRDFLGHVTPYSDGTMAIAYSNCLVFYDWRNKVELYNVLTDTSITNCVGMFYSKKHNVVISLHWQTGDTHWVRVWSMSPRPATLSNPAAVTPLAKCKVSQIRVRLLGSYSEPCAGELIDFALTGAGTLLQTQATTDAQGYAVVDYAAPVDSLPTPQFTATMRF